MLVDALTKAEIIQILTSTTSHFPQQMYNLGTPSETRETKQLIAKQKYYVQQKAREQCN